MARRGLAGKIGAGMCVALGLVTLGGCVKNAATGKSIFTMGMPASQQIALGAQAAPEFTKQYGGAVKDAQACAYVNEVGKKLAAQTEGNNPSLPWEFTFLNSDVVNAFALPGGKVFFTRGLASRLTSEAQLAGVIGHEVGHVTAEHGLVMHSPLTQNWLSAQVTPSHGVRGEHETWHEKPSGHCAPQR